MSAALPAAQTLPETPRYLLAVRALCEFTAKRGDLDFRFTPAPSAQEGMAGHALVQGRRPARYQREVALSEDIGLLRVRGRADGFDPEAVRLEEIKTHRGPLEALPANHRALHRAQLRTYGALLCRARALDRLELCLVYLDLTTQEERVVTELAEAAVLREEFEARCRSFLDWAARELAHRSARDGALQTLRFPHAQFNAGQRSLGAAVFRAARDARPLLAQAPTGIGKSIATLFGMLKAAGHCGLDRIFVLTAKTSGRGPLLAALQSVHESTASLPLRVLEFAAKEAACEHPGRACHGASCPLARGFYDRLPAARGAALAERWLGQPRLRELALEHQVCPYYLAQELVRWCDVVVADFNHYFDASALLYGLTLACQWRVGVLVDEAHNLLERARQMYTAVLDPIAFASARRVAPAGLGRAFARLAQAWAELEADLVTDYQATDEPSDSLLAAVKGLAGALTEHLGTTLEAPAPDLQRFAFDARFFSRLCEQAGPHAMFDITRARASSPDAPLTRLALRNVIPAPHLVPRFAAARACVLFSATLSPQGFYRDTLGLPADCDTLEVGSPFDPGQLEIHLSPGISTRWRDRPTSVRPIVELMARQFRKAPGNYLAFFSSFEYLQRVLAEFRARHPAVTVWEQSPRMSGPERRDFLARFTAGSRGIGFAVLGGAFAEGIDLPNERLIGAFIATLGLPPVTPMNEEISRRLGQVFDAAFEYTYLYPGLQKVVQAAGRVIRTKQDQGVIHLIDDRYRRDEVKALLPRWWRLDA